MKNKKIEKIVMAYNDELRDVRKQYINNKHYSEIYKYLLDIVPIVFCVFVLLCFKLDLTLMIFLLLIMCVLYTVIFFFKKDPAYKIMNKYLSCLKSNGISSISLFENVMENYITGEGNYSMSLLHHYMEEYGVDDSTKLITDMNKKKYFVWCDDSYFYLLPVDATDLVFLKKIKLSDIYYFRKTQISTIIKCSMDVLSFDIFSFDTINTLLPNKKFENIDAFEPDKYVSDFELYMHSFREKHEGKSYLKVGSVYPKIITLIVLSFIVFGLYYFKIVNNSNYIKIIISVLYCFLGYYFGTLTDNMNYKSNDENKILDYAIHDEKTLEMFRELKVALNVYDNYDKVYTNTNACYLCWVQNGYFHVFLNHIYFNCVYMVINLKDIDYYYVNKNEVVLQSKVKTLSFRKDAKKLFDKILPNKDYAWLKGLKK